MYDNFLIRKDSLKNDVDEDGNVIGFQFAARMQTTEEFIFPFTMVTTSR